MFYVENSNDRSQGNVWPCNVDSKAVVLTLLLAMVQIDAIFRHESQKDRALFPGADPREFWQRARDRNKVLHPSHPGQYLQ